MGRWDKNNNDEALYIKAGLISQMLYTRDFVLGVGAFIDDCQNISLVIIDDGTISDPVIDQYLSLTVPEISPTRIYASACYLALADKLQEQDRDGSLCRAIKERPEIGLVFVRGQARTDQGCIDELVFRTQDPFFCKRIQDTAMIFSDKLQDFKRDSSFPGFVKDGLPSSRIMMRMWEERIMTTTWAIGKKIEEGPDSIGFEAIGGQAEAKKQVMRLALALKNPQSYARRGIRPPRGVLLHGPPGAGKTLLARALAAETGVQFYVADASQLSSEWYGRSEKNIDEVFARARKTGGIIFFDEADSLAPSRSDINAHEVTKRIVAALNRNMDGFSPLDGVVVFLATNRLDDLDTAFIRTGRIDRIIEVPLPNADGRAEIIRIHMAGAEKRAGSQLFDNVDIKSLVQKTAGYSGSDLAELIRRTLEQRVAEEDAGGVAGLAATADITKEIDAFSIERQKNTKPKLGFRSQAN